MRRKKKQVRADLEFTLYLSDDAGGFDDRRTEEHLSYDGFKVFWDEQRQRPLPQDDDFPAAPGVFFCRVAGVSHHSQEVNHASIDLGTPLVLRADPDNVFDPNAIEVVNPATKGIVGYLPAPMGAQLATTTNTAGGGMAAVLGIWTKDGRKVALRIVGSIGRNFGVTTGPDPGREEAPAQP